jgi:undecaprenyl-diphosphatase
MDFSWIVLGSLLGGCAVMMLLEWRGLPTTLSLTFKGDIKRESRWLAQYGQAVCSVVVAAVVWQLESAHRGRAVQILVAFALASLIATAMKKLLSRVRPGRENAGRFLGPSFSRGNYKESFPSSHSACALALSTVLAANYPAAAATFFALGGGCAVLRYLLDAHWPSDVLGGSALGYACGFAAMTLVPA